MRRSAVIFFVTLAFLLALCLRSVSTLLALLIEDGGVDAIQRSDLPSPNSSLIETRPQLIPKIIHQTYKNDSIPEMWKNARQSCIDLHPDYEHMVYPFPPSAVLIPLTSLVMDRRKVYGFHRQRISLVPRNLPELSLFYPAC